MATLKWSVWDPARQRYAVYHSQGLGRDPAIAPSPPWTAPKGSASPLGAAPEAVMPTLPFGAQKVGQSDTPVGRIAQEGSSWGTLALAAGAAYLGWRWWKRRRKR